MRTTLNNIISTFDKVKRLYPEFEGISMIPIDSRLVCRKVALFYTANDNHSMRTDYMTYSEMRMYLYGYMACKEGNFIELPF